VASAVVKVNVPLAATFSAFPPLSSRVTEAPVLNPVTVPPIVWVTLQVTATLVTLAAATVPVPFATVQSSPVGWTLTVTAYAAPTTRGVVNVNVPLAATFSPFVPLSSNVTEAPVLNPETVPPIV